MAQWLRAAWYERADGSGKPLSPQDQHALVASQILALIVSSDRPWFRQEALDHLRHTVIVIPAGSDPQLLAQWLADGLWELPLPGSEEAWRPEHALFQRPTISEQVDRAWRVLSEAL